MYDISENQSNTPTTNSESSVTVLEPSIYVTISTETSEIIISTWGIHHKTWRKTKLVETSSKKEPELPYRQVIALKEPHSLSLIGQGFYPWYVVKAIKTYEANNHTGIHSCDIDIEIGEKQVVIGLLRSADAQCFYDVSVKALMNYRLSIVPKH